MMTEPPLSSSSAAYGINCKISPMPCSHTHNSISRFKKRYILEFFPKSGLRDWSVGIDSRKRPTPLFEHNHEASSRLNSTRNRFSRFRSIVRACLAARRASSYIPARVMAIEKLDQYPARPLSFLVLLPRSRVLHCLDDLPRSALESPSPILESFGILP